MIFPAIDYIDVPLLVKNFSLLKTEIYHVYTVFRENYRYKN